MDYQLARDRDQHLACELFGYREDSNEAAFIVASVEKIYAHESLTFNNKFSYEVEIWATKGLLDKEKGNVLGIEIVRDQSGNTLRVSQSRFYNGKLVQTLLERHSILSLEGSLSRDYDVENNASADVGMLDKFDRGLQTDVHVFVDFDYVMGRSITVMEKKRPQTLEDLTLEENLKNSCDIKATNIILLRMFKDDSLRIMRLTQERVKLREQGLSTLLEMQMQINQGKSGVTIARVNAIFLSSVLQRRE
nr:zinc finger, CCHC-type [Tanacetum cinerariifolium]